MIKKYVFRDDHGSGNMEISLCLDVEHMPLCFDTFMEWVISHVQPAYRHVAWKLVHEEDFKKQRESE